MRSVILALSCCVVSCLASSYGERTYTAREPDQENLIVDSPETSISKYPSAAIVLDYDDVSKAFKYHCGGAILNLRSILTAATCVNEFVPIHYWRIRVGSSYINRDGVTHDVSQKIIHPEYNMCTHDNDIAILRTATFFDYNDNVKRAPISGRNYVVPDGDAVWAIGWGINREYEQPWNSTDKLREMRSLNVNLNTCREFYKTSSRLSVSDRMMCIGLLGVPGRRPCINNDGSPLYHDGVFVGLRAWSEVLRECSENGPEVYMKASSYLDWILVNI